jgi:hypothetical protein
VIRNFMGDKERTMLEVEAARAVSNALEKVLLKTGWARVFKKPW